ncbi:MAG: hypothetical protein Q9220_004390 [cf. Caloplaca sp. 1 TL-2023]
MAHPAFQSPYVPVPSSDGSLIASIAKSQLLIYLSRTTEIIHSYDLPTGFAQACRFVRWFRPTKPLRDDISSSGAKNHDGNIQQRVLLADDTRIMVFDMEKAGLFAEISGATSIARFAAVEFGWTADDIMVFSDFGFKLQIWSLPTKRAIEIKDPKSIALGYSYRPDTGHLALLTRPAAYDVLMVLAPSTYELLATHTLATVDARGLKYSPDGKWIAVWETAAAGFRVLLLTADGHLFKNYLLPDAELNLGIECIGWSPSAEHLAVADHEGVVTILGRDRLTSQMKFVSRSTIMVPDGKVWQEEIGPSHMRGYAEAKQPTEPPSLDPSTSNKAKNSDMSQMEFNLDGSLLAFVNSTTPTTMRIYSLRTGTSLIALVHHSPIKVFHWHPEIPDLILIRCSMAQPVIHMWRAKWSIPRIFTLSLKAPIGHPVAYWLSTHNDKVRFMLGTTEQLATSQCTLDGEETSWQPGVNSIEGFGPEDMFDEGNSLDLSPHKISDDEAFAEFTPALGLSTQLGHSLEIDKRIKREEWWGYAPRLTNRAAAEASACQEELPSVYIRSSFLLMPVPFGQHLAPQSSSQKYSEVQDAYGDGGIVVKDSTSAMDMPLHSGGMVMIQLLRYSSTPVGPYDEMLVAPGNFDVPGGHGSHTRITRIYVSQRDTTFNGRKNWNIPKHIARFKCTGNFSAPPFTIQLFPEDPANETPFFTASLKPLGFWTPSFPFSSKFLKRIGVPSSMVQPPLPSGEVESKDVVCGTDRWCKSEPVIYSPKAKLIWMDLKQPEQEGKKGSEHWWPGIKRWHVGVWLQNAQLDLGESEVIKP